MNWVSAFMPLVSALLLVAAAVCGYLHNRRTAKKQSALSFVAQYEVHHGKEWNDARLLSLSILKDKSQWQPMLTQYGAGTLPEHQREHLQTVFTWLNHHELVAIGVYRGSLDRETYVEWNGDQYRKYWNVAKDFIVELRPPGEADPYQYFEKFAKSLNGQPVT